jgi:hypothetical protein
MTYGMKIYSGNGALQLDSNDPTHLIYQKHTSGTSSAITDAAAPEYGSTTITVSGFTLGEDLIFIQPTGSAVVKAYVRPGGSGFTIYSSVNTSFYYHVFKKVTSLPDPSTQYGLVLKDASNNVIFNPERIAARVKGRITGTGGVSLSGKSLYALGTFKFSAVTAALAPRRGKIYGWVHTWNSARDQVLFSSAKVSGLGYQASGEADMDDAFYFDNSLTSTLIIEAPDPI